MAVCSYYEVYMTNMELSHYILFNQVQSFLNGKYDIDGSNPVVVV